MVSLRWAVHGAAPGATDAPSWRLTAGAVYIAPWAVGEDGTQWLERFETVEAAMQAADRYVAGYLDAAGE